MQLTAREARQGSVSNTEPETKADIYVCIPANMFQSAVGWPEEPESSLGCKSNSPGPNLLSSEDDAEHATFCDRVRVMRKEEGSAAPLRRLQDRRIC